LAAETDSLATATGHDEREHVLAVGEHITRVSVVRTAGRDAIRIC
jgi:hypothetical protein